MNNLKCLWWVIGSQWLFLRIRVQEWFQARRNAKRDAKEAAYVELTDAQLLAAVLNIVDNYKAISVLDRCLLRG